MAQEPLAFNGINGATGGPLLPLDRRQLADLVPKQPGPSGLSQVRGRRRQLDDIADGGWGVVFPRETDPAIVDALRPLLRHRRVQAGDFYHEFGGEKGFPPGGSTARFLAEHSRGMGVVDPRRVPYYLLLVGGPEAIPFRVQHELSVQYAVGRVAFDSVEAYAQYADNVVAAETGTALLARRAGFFGVQNPGDKATRHSLELLNLPLIESLSEDRQDWKIDRYLREDATKARLEGLLGGDDRPTLLFTTSHGMGFPRDDELQMVHSGALLCQDWPGPEAWDRDVPEDHYFSADDVGESADLRGMITFHFACFGAGVPEKDSFGQGTPSMRETLAERPFLCRLPQRLLSHSRGPLAFIGHVDRAWGFSFCWPESGSQPAPFEEALTDLMDGETVGYAMRSFGYRHGMLAAMLAGALDEAWGDDPGAENRDPTDEILDLWTATNDAKSYAILGDPAVRLRVGDP